MKRSLVLKIALVSFWLVATPLAAEEKKAETPADKILDQYGDAEKWASQYVYDTSVPAAPALSLVQGAPELSVSSLFGADKSSDLVLTGEKPGLAFAARPFWLSDKSRFVTLDAYRALTGPRALYSRTTVSFAAAPKVEDSKTGLGAAFGVSAELLKRADPRQDLVLGKCLNTLNTGYRVRMETFTNTFSTSEEYLPNARLQARLLVNAASTPELEGQSRDGLIEKIDAARNMDEIDRELPSLALQSRFADWRKAETAKAFATDLTKVEEGWKTSNAACFKRAGLAAENEYSFQIATGLAASSPDFKVENLSYAGVSVWAAYRIPLGPYDTCGQLGQVEMEASNKTPRNPLCLPPPGNLTVFVQATDRGKATVAGAEKKATITQAGLVLSRKSRANTWSVAGSAVWVQRDFADRTLKTQDFTRYGLSYSRKVKTGVWLEASFGETRGMPTDEESYGLVRLTFK